MELNSKVAELVKKYSVSGPRYTSYPTAPQWTDKVTIADYRTQLKKTYADPKLPVALYVHIPFCESLCYYCGCNIQITKDHNRSGSYVESLLREMKATYELLGHKQLLSHIAWGGGTPTFLSLSEIEQLQKGTLEYFALDENAEVSIEIDPRVTTNRQLELLRELGFNRVSLGVQDFEKNVQEAINRVQPLEQTETMLKYCRQLGYKGINFDLIYGLPHQTTESFEKTIDSVIRIRPDRIALYNYAHLPHMLPHQKILDAMNRPEADERLKIFSLAFEKLTKAGYRTVGMDHFAVEEDELFKALDKGTLYRNFQGYTIKHGAGMIGIGASSIGEVGDAYFQNEKNPKAYEEKLSKDGLATMRGVLFTEDDRQRKWIILSLMCRFELNYTEYKQRFGGEFKTLFESELNSLNDLIEDRLLIKNEVGLKVTELGRLFVRNIAMVFDAYLKQSKVTYSKTV